MKKWNRHFWYTCVPSIVLSSLLRQHRQSIMLGSTKGQA